MAAGHVDTTIKTNVQNNTVANAVLDATVIHAWRDEVANKIDGNYDDTQTKLDTKIPQLSGTQTPIGSVLPTVIGQIYTDRTTGLIYIATALTNTSWIIPYPNNAMALQAIINAAMEIWQQGTSFTNPANSSYTADMWFVDFAAGGGTFPTTIIHSQSTLTAGELYGARFAYNINVNGAGSSYGVSSRYTVRQRIEYGTSRICGNGKVITISFYAKSNIASKRIGVGVRQNYGTGGSPSTTEDLAPTITSVRTLSSTMALYTFTFLTNSLTGKTFGTNKDDYLEIAIYSVWGTTISNQTFGASSTESFLGSGDISFTEVVVNSGYITLPFQPKSFAQELQDCLRYYEKSYPYAVNPATGSTAGGLSAYPVPSNTIAASQSYGSVRYGVKKRISNPTVTIYPFTTPSNTGRISANNGVDLAANSGSVAQASESVFTVYNGSGSSLTTVDSSIFFHWTSDARL